MVSKLEAEAQESGQLVRLQEGQLAALGNMLMRRDRRSFLVYVITSAVFFGLGVLIATLVGH